jgi:hypothetical protein
MYLKGRFWSDFLRGNQTKDILAATSVSSSVALLRPAFRGIQGEAGERSRLFELS